MTDERARDALDHLQSAGLELIAAARAFLDVAEDLVRDPAVVGVVVKTLGSLGEAVRSAVDHRPTGAAAAAPEPGRPGGDAAPVEHIPLS